VLTTLGSPEVESGVGLVRTGLVARREVRLRCEKVSGANVTKRRNAERTTTKMRASFVLIKTSVSNPTDLHARRGRLFPAHAG
jgi:hypothetical protein